MKIDDRLINAWAFARYEREARERGVKTGIAGLWNREAKSVRRSYREAAEQIITATFGRALRWL